MKDYSNFSDKELIFLIKNKDDCALEHLMDRYTSLLMKIAIYYLKHEEDAEEIVADFFIKIWEKNAALTIESTFKPYACISVKNSCINLLKAKSLQHNLRNFNDASNFEVVSEAQSDDLIIFEELRNDLMEFINHLPEKRKVILKLAKFENLSLDEIGEMLDLSPKTVANQIALALKDIKQFLILSKD
ncbi:RNA polymerase sigma factor [Belliella kenyensis]|uniref:RNA polymerase sigma factor n=1 Tax=Belliella kenyensis TaxID=1472724 RepID=A0ABV8EIR7_9BACT|nr:RNA polymerase sigma-70 factor [Belliella kenyensis]MCH7400300.1 RNA polymerase sigma-70 factor [Belliella kenyensis]MDN3604682.1 RNA polymerase sigma-70 factor [Belliella kenyensis]